MGFLHKLWDETLAGPAPETGLSKLRKYDSFSAGSSALAGPGDEIAVSRSITVVRTKSDFMKKFSVDTGSAPASPAAGSAPATPFTPGTPREDFKRLTRRKGALEPHPESTRPTSIDWIVISGLDR